MTSAEEMRGGQIGGKVNWRRGSDRGGTARGFIGGNGGDGVAVTGE